MSAGQMLLKRADEVDVVLHADGFMMLRTRRGVLQIPHFGLVVLQAFARPRPLQEALDDLGGAAAGREEWMEMASVVVRMREAGVLVEEGSEVGATASHVGFTSPAEHVSMLNDEVRTLAFANALREVVTPGDVVVEIGAGTGVLSMSAAKAGARKVYAIEGTAAAGWTERNVSANGLDDRVEVLRGWSTELVLPEPADVLVTETIGNEALEEGILEWVIDARRRLLKNGAQIIPRRVRLLAAALEIPDEVAARGQFQAQMVERWRRVYDLDFHPLLDSAVNDGFTFQAAQQDVARWRAVSEPVVLADLDMLTVEAPFVDATATGRVVADGQAGAAVLWFDLELSDNHGLHRPWDDADKANSWATPVWVLGAPLPVRVGDQLTFRYRYRVPDVPRQHALAVVRHRA